MIIRTWVLCLIVLGGCGEVVQNQCAVPLCGGVCCAANESCNAGTCSACGPNELSCGTTCVNPVDDRMNCGACGTTCDGTSTCGNSECNACPTGEVACGNTCADTQTDPANCGMCGKACDTGLSCVDGACALLGYYALTGTPSPSTVLNVIDQTYKFPNNLANSIWQRESNMIVTGEFSQPGYWAFPAGSTGYVTVPDRDTGTGLHSRMVLVPATDSVLYTTQANPNTSGPSLPGQIMIATISRTTGLLATPQTAVFSDGHTAGCQLHSASATQFLCLTNNTVRRYATARNSATLTYVDTITLSTTLPAATPCGTCFGGVFAFDGAYFYFSNAATGNTNLGYSVYDANGTFLSMYTAAGTASINSIYFDWSVGRYSTHDGYGGRSGGAIYTTTSTTDGDSHAFSAVSTAHTPR